MRTMNLQEWQQILFLEASGDNRWLIVHPQVDRGTESPFHLPAAKAYSCTSPVQQNYIMVSQGNTSTKESSTDKPHICQAI